MFNRMSSSNPQCNKNVIFSSAKEEKRMKREQAKRKKYFPSVG